MRYKAFFGDTFLYVDAISEEHAQQLAFEELRANMRPEDFTTWAEPEEHERARRPVR